MKQRALGHRFLSFSVLVLAAAIASAASASAQTAAPNQPNQEAIGSSSLLQRLYQKSSSWMHGLLQKFSGSAAPSKATLLTRESVNQDRIIAALKSKYPGLLERLRQDKGISEAQLLELARGKSWFTDLLNLAETGHLASGEDTALHTGLKDMIQNDLHLQPEIVDNASGAASTAAISSDAPYEPLFTTNDGREGTRAKYEDVPNQPTPGLSWGESPSAPPGPTQPTTTAPSQQITSTASALLPPLQAPGATDDRAAPTVENSYSARRLATVSASQRTKSSPEKDPAHQGSATHETNPPPPPHAPDGRSISKGSSKNPKVSPPAQPPNTQTAKPPSNASTLIREGGERQTVSTRISSSFQVPPASQAPPVSQTSQTSQTSRASRASLPPRGTEHIPQCTEFPALAQPDQLNRDPFQQRLMQEQLWQFVKVSIAARNFGSKADPMAIHVASSPDAGFLAATESATLYDSRCAASSLRLNPEDQARCYHLMMKPGWQRTIEQSRALSTDSNLSSRDQESAAHIAKAYTGYLNDHRTKPFYVAEDRLNYVMCDPSNEGRTVRTRLLEVYLRQMETHEFADTLLNKTPAQDPDLQLAIDQHLNNPNYLTKLANRLCKNLQTHISLYAGSTLTLNKIRPEQTRRRFAEQVYDDTLTCGGPLGLGRFVMAIERGLRKAADYCGVPEVKVFEGKWKEWSKNITRGEREWLWSELLLQHEVKNASKIDFQRLYQTKLGRQQLEQFYQGSELGNLMGGLNASWKDPQTGETRRWVDSLTACEDIDSVYRTVVKLITNKYFEALDPGADYEQSYRHPTAPSVHVTEGG